MTTIRRREALALFGAGAAVLGGVPAAGAGESKAASGAELGKHEPKPLPFDPAKLKGLSEKLLVSHHDNNYVGSVKALNTIEGRLAQAMQDPEFPPLVYGGLKREELHRLGSVVLHEHYFGNLGGDGKPGGEIGAALKTRYGSVEAWETEFRRTAMSLAGGSGWCVLGYNTYLKELRTQWAWDHMHGAIASVPLLVLDMYEHAYAMDFGAEHAQYIDAFFKNIAWDAVEARYDRAMKALAALG
jgi:Fe-Mn family superoxide dismutase